MNLQGARVGRLNESWRVRQRTGPGLTGCVYRPYQQKRQLGEELPVLFGQLVAYQTVSQQRKLVAHAHKLLRMALALVKRLVHAATPSTMECFIGTNPGSPSIRASQRRMLGKGSKDTLPSGARAT
jgi:hypothetical protein